MAKTKRWQGSKRAWVIAQPSSVPAARLVALGARAGVRLTRAQVHTIRSAEKRRASDAPRVATVPTRDGVVLHSVRVDGAEQLLAPGVAVELYGRPVAARFAELALEVGLARSQELLARVRRVAAELGAS